MRTRPKAQCDQLPRVCVCVPPFWLTLSCLVRRVVVVVVVVVSLRTPQQQLAHSHTRTHTHKCREKVRV